MTFSPRRLPFGGRESGLDRAPASRTLKRDRIALATWPNATSSRFVASLQLDWEEMKAAHGGLAPVSIVAWAVGQAVAANPMINRRVVLWGIRPNAGVRVSLAIETSDDLQVAVVDNADRLTPRELQRAALHSTRAARGGRGVFSKHTRLLSRFPVAVSRPALRVWSFLTAGLGFTMLGIGPAPMGVALISSVERFGVDAVQPPFIPFSRCAFVISVGARHEAVVVRDGQAVVRVVIVVTVAADHRIFDGTQFAHLSKDFVRACVTP